MDGDRNEPLRDGTGTRHIRPGSVAGRIRALPGRGAFVTDEIPDPLALIDISAKSGVSVDWLLHGGPDRESQLSKPNGRGRGKPPPVNLVLRQPELTSLKDTFGGASLADIVREVIATWDAEGSVAEAASAIAREAAQRITATRLADRTYINATGIIVHTGWGNAPLSPSARNRLAEATGPTPTGGAGAYGRSELCEQMLRRLTGAESAAVTTSNAASLLLVGGALASGREIVVAARDLLEISQGARIRDIMEASGARLVPVGAANRVNIDDFRGAITGQTAAILRSHASNIAMTGYVEHVPTPALVELGRERRISCIVNLGGGSLVDLGERGLPECPTIRQALDDGADLVLASGDKIIGGPQAGIIVGKQALIARLVRHPLARTCRPGKLTLAALEATLAAYAAGRAWQEIPVLRLLGEPLVSIRERALSLAALLRRAGYDAVDAEDRAQCGGAVLPGVDLPTWTIRVSHAGLTEEELYALLVARQLVARRGHGAVVLDLRSVLPEDDARLLSALGASA